MQGGERGRASDFQVKRHVIFSSTCDPVSKLLVRQLVVRQRVHLRTTCIVAYFYKKFNSLRSIGPAQTLVLFGQLAFKTAICLRVIVLCVTESIRQILLLDPVIREVMRKLVGSTVT